ncbi:hypothetical protein LCS82_09130 [Vibrio harveyi]|uniref:hypothetical protein n=1 Tax=Vibrio harveyi TaxID=669 RepID=UPI003BB776E9
MTIKNTVEQCNQNGFSYHSGTTLLTGIDYEPVVVSNKPLYSTQIKMVRMAVLLVVMYLLGAILLPCLMSALDGTETFSLESYALTVVASTLCSVIMFSFAINTFDSEIVVSESSASNNIFAEKVYSENL